MQLSDVKNSRARLLEIILQRTKSEATRSAAERLAPVVVVSWERWVRRIGAQGKMASR